MTKPKEKIKIEPRLLYELLGNESIEVASIVFAELIKNSYDAKAKKSILDFSKFYEDKIVISDDGIGMNSDDLRNNWLTVGTNNKATNRNALGGKGIGRFSLFRLAKSITIISKKENYNECKLILNEEDLRKANEISDFEIEIIENDIPVIFKDKGQTGTNIILTNLNYINFNETFEDLYNLIQPDVENKIPFSKKIIYPSNFEESNILKINEAVKYAPFYCEASFSENNLLNYKFVCRINNKVIYENNNFYKLRQNFSKLDSINLGEIKFYLYNFYFDRKYINLLSIPQSSIQNEFLNIYQGISVYRENFKIYGHGKDDWLKLAEKRVGRFANSIDNKLSFGYVALKRPDSDPLKEKTSRESFMRSPELDYFTSAIEFIIGIFNDDRSKSISIIRKNDYAVVKKLLNTSQNNNDTTTDKTTIQKQIPIDNQKKSNIYSDDSKTTIEQNDSKTTISTSDDEKNESSSESAIDRKKVTIHPKPPRPTYSKETIIDASFTCLDSTPEKIKRIIYELQTIKSNCEYAQSLLLRCLIDTSTQYAQEKLNIPPNKNDLLGNIMKVLNLISSKKLLPNKTKHIDELRILIKEDQTIKYFNGIVHDYDYKAHFQDIKRIWDKFEFYIEFCIEQ